jgi:hypothetical protein
MNIRKSEQAKAIMLMIQNNLITPWHNIRIDNIRRQWRCFPKLGTVSIDNAII